MTEFLNGPEKRQKVLSQMMKDHAKLSGLEVIGIDDMKVDRVRGGVFLPDGTFLKEEDIVAAIEVLEANPPEDLIERAKDIG
jgi:hypothetical protein